MTSQIKKMNKISSENKFINHLASFFIYMLFVFAIASTLVFSQSPDTGSKIDVVSNEFSKTDMYKNLKHINVEYLRVYPSGRVFVLFGSGKKLVIFDKNSENYPQYINGIIVNPKKFSLKISGKSEYYGDGPRSTETKEEFFGSINFQISSIINNIQNQLEKEKKATDSWSK